MEESIECQLKNALPKSLLPYQVIHLQTIPKETHPLIQKPTREKQTTVKIIHFITLFHNEIPILAVELYVYLRIFNDGESIDRTIYVSKADTTGLSSKIKIKVSAILSIFLKWVITYPITNYISNLKFKKEYIVNLKPHKPFKSPVQRSLHILSERYKKDGGDVNYGMPVEQPSKRLTISSEKVGILESQGVVSTRVVLFTRAEPQYLFPESSKNPGKHVLTDDQLLKWWLKLLNGCINSTFQKISKKSLNILNAESRQISKFFPSNDWTVGDVYSRDDNKGELAVYNIPLLPDDPKGRFLEHLVVENRIKKVKLRQFWTELSIRQEFRLGMVVGLIGIQGIAKTTDNNKSNNDNYILKLDKKKFKKLKELIAGVDYSDTTCQTQVFKDVIEAMDNLKLDQSCILRCLGNDSQTKSQPQPQPLVATPTKSINIMSVRSKKRKTDQDQDQDHESQKPAYTAINDLTSMIKSRKK
ncbi:hypothetical protein CANARDRAFT_29010 [[Candida] arabinofermentans NRRL YB-2248]|uniref:histone acetyltransferase n=1 Tax=[Candida] arabinofermentans NRRL YB-2248 TaxID=983967 RepID=A0A1E4SYA7_9ASCO|nr:hypothetical protein CANARDRAFT_29010 [[Candida] arabinofermentans NRRL YB-2248]